MSNHVLIFALCSMYSCISLGMHFKPTSWTKRQYPKLKLTIYHITYSDKAIIRVNEIDQGCGSIFVLNYKHCCKDQAFERFEHDDIGMKQCYLPQEYHTLNYGWFVYAKMVSKEMDKR